MIINLCPLCRSTRFDYLFEGKDRQYHLPGNFKVYRCRDCGLITTLPELEEHELANYYPDHYYSYLNSANAPAPKSRGEKFRFYLSHPLNALNAILYSKLLRQNEDLPASASSRVLDIGCGDGRYLLEKRKEHALCFGVDINEAALARLREKAPDISTFCGNVWDAGYPDDFFDIINLCHVLEHVKSVDHLLSEIRRILKPDGLLRVQIPNSSSFSFKIFGRYWMPLDVPRHVHTFSIKNLTRLFRDSGFQVVRCRTLENSFSVITSSVYVYNELCKKKLEIMTLGRLWDNELLKFFLFPYCFIVNLWSRGDVAEFILKKS